MSLYPVILSLSCVVYFASQSPFNIIPITGLYCYFSSQVERCKCDKVVECNRSQVNILSNSKYKNRPLLHSGKWRYQLYWGLGDKIQWSVWNCPLKLWLVSFICVCMTGIQKKVRWYHAFIGLCSTSNLLLTFI